MKIRARSLLFLVASTAATGLAVGLAGTTVIGQVRSSDSTAESTPKTPWGAPDLQGTWSNTTVVPFERAKEFGNRELMNDTEYTKALDQLLARNNRAGRDSREINGQDIRGTEKDVARAYNEHWFGDKPTDVSRRTSMIIDPPDGRMPALIPEAQKRISEKREYLQALLQGTSGGRPGPISPRRNEPSPDYNLDRMNRSDGPEDRSGVERCLLNSLPVILQAGPLTPDGRPLGNFGGVMRIVESPDSVDMYYDIGQGTGFNRTIPITNRPHLPKDVHQYWGDSIARWEGETLVVDVTNFSQKTNFRGSRENLHLIDALVALDQVQVFARAAEICLLAEIRNVDDQSFAFPPGDRIAPVLVNVLWQVRPVRDRDRAIEPCALADVVVHVDRIRALDDPHHATEIAEGPSVRRQRSCLENYRKAIQQATLNTAAVLGTVGAIHAIEVVVWRRLVSARRDRSGPAAGSTLQERLEVLSFLADSLLRLRYQGRHPAIGRVDDHRRAAAYVSWLIAEPMLVVRAGNVLFRATDVLPVNFSTVPSGAIVALKQLVESLLVLSVVHKFPVTKLLGSLEWDNGRVTPCTLQVRGAPRSLGRRFSCRITRTDLANNCRLSQADGKARRGRRCDQKQKGTSSDFHLRPSYAERRAMLTLIIITRHRMRFERWPARNARETRHRGHGVIGL